MAFCAKCGYKLLPKAKFCHRCGAIIPDAKLLARVKSEEKPVKKVVVREEPEKIVKEPEKVAERIVVKEVIIKEKGGGKGKWVAAIVILVVLGFMGYTYITEKAALEQIEASISGIGMPSVGFTSASFPITMSFENPSSSSSPPFTLTYEVRVGSSTVVTGSTSVSPISSSGTKTSTLNVSISYTDVGSATWGVISSGHFSVTVSGMFEGKAVFGLIPISKSFSTTYSL